ncbi:metallophosphoesterase [Zhongshania sp.]|uniref:metallophosphoesterase n=1 Tax=Zhongshania sp. TaxID=1971902 RepID=UPI0035650ACA
MLVTGALQAQPVKQIEAGGKVSFAGDFTLDRRGYEALPITNLPVNDSETQFQFAIMSDRTGGARTPVFHRALRKLNLLQPEFVVSVGDMIEGYTEDRATVEAEWDDFNGMIDELTMPYVYTPGNHDYTNDVMANIWRERYGADYYHFVYKNTLFLVLNTEADLNGPGRPGISETQLAYMEKVLKKNRQVAWTLIFLHQPVWRMGDTDDWNRLADMLGSRPYTAFAGHMHSYEYATNDKGRELITLSSTGGVSQLRGKAYGEFDHVTWVTMKEDGPVLAHIELDGIVGKHVTSPEFTEVFGKAPLFSMDPWFSQSTGKQRGELVLRASNPFSKPMDYRFEAIANPGFLLEEWMPEGKLAPGESRIFKVPVKKVVKGEVRPLQLRARGDVALDNIERADWTVNFKSEPVMTYSVPRKRKAITVDGDISEWPALRFKGPAQGQRGRYDREGEPETVAVDDLSYRFDVRYDDEFFYVAVDVTDDWVTDQFHSLGGGQDVVSVVLDARPISASAHNTGTTKTLKSGDWSALILSPDRKGGTQPLASLTPKVFTAKLKEHDYGYSLEVSAPLSYLAQKQGGDWQSIRLNVSVADHDDEPQHTLPLIVSWQEPWDRGVVGSGTFFRKH